MMKYVLKMMKNDEESIENEILLLEMTGFILKPMDFDKDEGGVTHARRSKAIWMPERRQQGRMHRTVNW